MSGYIEYDVIIQILQEGLRQFFFDVLSPLPPKFSYILSAMLQVSTRLFSDIRAVFVDLFDLFKTCLSWR